MSDKQRDKDDLLDKLTWRTMIILLSLGGMIWLFSLWVEDRFGRDGSVALAVIAIVVVTVGVVLMVGLLFAKLYRAGVVDTIRGQQITQEGNTRAVTEVTRAVRGELTLNARTNYVNAKRDFNVEKVQAAALLTDQQAQRKALAVKAQQEQDEIDAQYWETGSSIQYDQ